MSTDRYFSAAEARLRYRDEGAGPALVFVHGWTLDLEMWEPQAQGLQQHFRIIRFDRRGFGLSSGTADMQQDATDLIALCRHLRALPFSCVGMSQGARVVLSVATREPRYLDRFVLDGPPDLVRTPDGPRPETSPSGDLDYKRFAALAQRAGLDAFRREWLQHPLATLQTKDATSQRLLQRMIARYPGKDLLSTPETQSQQAPDELDLYAITRRGFVINGSRDTTARLRAGEDLARALSCGRSIVPMAGHLPNLDNPSAYNTLLLEFLSATAAAR